MVDSPNKHIVSLCINAPLAKKSAVSGIQPWVQLEPLLFHFVVCILIVRFLLFFWVAQPQMVCHQGQQSWRIAAVFSAQLPACDCLPFSRFVEQRCSTTFKRNQPLCATWRLPCNLVLLIIYTYCSFSMLFIFPVLVYLGMGWEVFATVANGWKI